MNKNVIISNTIWKFLERSFSQIISFVISVFLSRLLMPEDYGIVAIVLIFISIADVFVTSGFSTALIQKKNPTESDFSTNFYCSLLLSIIIYIGLYISAPSLASWYKEPNLKMVLRVFSIKIPLSSLGSIQHAYVEKNMLFKKYFISTLFGTIFSGIAGIVMAYSGFGVWSLVAQYLLNSFIDSIVLMFTVQWRPKFLFSCKAAQEMMGYGWKIMAADFSGTFFEQLRGLVIGKVYPGYELAYYNKGYQLPNLITANVCSSIMAVLFPAIASINDDIEKVKHMTRNAVKCTTYIVFPLMFGLGTISTSLIPLLFTEKWNNSIPYVRIMSVSLAIGVIGSVSLQTIKALGRSDIVFKMEFIKKPIYVLLLFLSIHKSVITVAYSMLVYNIIGNLINCSYVKKIAGYEWKEQLNDILPSILLSISMCVVITPICFLPCNQFLILVLQVLVGFLAYVVLSLITHNQIFHQLLLIIYENYKKQKNVAHKNYVKDGTQ